MRNKIGKEFNPNAWVWMKNERKRKKRHIIAEVLADYCSHASLHGIQYLGGKDKTLPEKIWWIIIFIASLTVCLYLITDTWLKWKQNPVMLSFEKEHTPIWTIPFPSVTICPTNKVLQSKYNYTELFFRRHNLNKDEYKRFWDISLVCDLEELYGDIFESTIDFTDEEAIKNIYNVAPKITDIIFYTKWENNIVVDVFAKHINKEGLCYSFNSLIRDDTKEIDRNTKNRKWSMEDGYSTNFHPDDYPRRTAQDGYGSGLHFVLYSYASDTDYICGPPISGYKVILHNPIEIAKASKRYYLISTDSKATIMIKPELTYTSTTLRSLPAHARKCYFSNEKNLKFFESYTQSNCRLECETNITELYCGCVPYYMPRTEKTVICGFGKNQCVKEIKKKILEFQMMEKGINMVEKEMKTTTYKTYDNCACLPACNNLKFAADILHTKAQFVQTAMASKAFDHFLNQKQKEELYNGTIRISEIDIFFRDTEFLALRRSELYGMSTFVANCGGFLGLFLGFSILSLVEIIYFLTLRIWCKIRTRN